MADASLVKTYNKMNAINRGIFNSGRSGYAQQHEWRNFNAEMEVLIRLTSDQTFNNFKIIPHTLNSRQHVSLSEYVSALNGVLHYIYHQYEPDTLNRPLDKITPTTQAQIHTTPINISQDINQSVDVSVEFNQTILGLNEVLTKNEDKYKKNTSEWSFIQKLKEMLPAAKSSLEVMTLVLQVGQAFKLPLEKIIELITRH